MRTTSREQRDSGLTLVETLIAMMLLTVIMAITLTVFVQVRDAYVRTDDEASGQMDVRTAAERLGRDIRSGRGVEVSATASQLQMWIDTDSDYKRGADEIVTWTLEPRGDGQFNVVRTLDGTPLIAASSVIDGLAFCYKVDATNPSCLPTPLDAMDATRARYIETTMRFDDRNAPDVGSAARTLRIAERMRNVG